MRKQTFVEKLTDVQRAWIDAVLLVSVYFFAAAAAVFIVAIGLGPSGVESVSALVLGIVCLILSLASGITFINLDRKLSR